MAHPTPPPPAAARLGALLLAYLAATTLLVTLSPFDFRLGLPFEPYLRPDTGDFFANIALFLPLGFLYRLARPDRGWRGGADVLLAGALFSLGIEVVQLFEPHRYSSPYDVLANAAGAWLGARLYDGAAARLRLDAARVGRLSLELPLVALLYLLVPLLWLSGMSAAPGTSRAWQPLLLGLTGALLLGAVQRHYFAPAGLLSAARMGAVAAGWFLVGALPALPRQPLLVAAGVAVVALTAWLAARAAAPGAERRFEAVALRAAALPFAAYLLLLARSPAGGSPDFGDALRRVELVGAVTVLGYALAEALGRRERGFAADLPWVLAGCGAAAAGLGLAAGDHAPAPAWLAALLLAGAAGGRVYHLQRALIREIRQGAGAVAGAAPAAPPQPRAASASSSFWWMPPKPPLLMKSTTSPPSSPPAR